MHRQLLITLLVAAIVIAFARARRGRVRSREPAEREAGGLPTGAVIGYALAALTILASAVFGWHWYQDANTIVEVEVVEAVTGARTVYHVRKKDLGNREFRTVDGRRISLGSADRMERVE